MSDPNVVADAWSIDDSSSRCPHCLDSGIKGYYYEHGDPRLVRYLACDCVAVTTQRRIVSGDLSALQDKTFDAFIAFPLLQSHVDRCQEYAANPCGWLLLHGPYGTGKSHLAAAIGNAVLARGGQVQFYAMPDLLDTLRETFDQPGGESFSQRFARIRNAPLVILDDVGTEKLTPWAAEKFYQLVNHRYNNRTLATVFTTNEPLNRFDGRIESRLSDVELCEHLDFTGNQDFRKLGLSQRRKAV